MHNIILSKESTMTQRKAIIRTMSNAGWTYMGTKYSMYTNTIELNFKEPINEINK